MKLMMTNIHRNNNDGNDSAHIQNKICNTHQDKNDNNKDNCLTEANNMND